MILILADFWAAPSLHDLYLHHFQKLLCWIQIVIVEAMHIVMFKKLRIPTLIYKTLWLNCNHLQKHDVLYTTTEYAIEYIADRFSVFTIILMCPKFSSCCCSCLGFNT